jgi:hypothetical protein
MVIVAVLTPDCSSPVRHLFPALYVVSSPTLLLPKSKAASPFPPLLQTPKERKREGSKASSVGSLSLGSCLSSHPMVELLSCAVFS